MSAGSDQGPVLLGLAADGPQAGSMKTSSQVLAAKRASESHGEDTPMELTPVPSPRRRPEAAADAESEGGDTIKGTMTVERLAGVPLDELLRFHGVLKNALKVKPWCRTCEVEVPADQRFCGICGSKVPVLTNVRASRMSMGRSSLRLSLKDGADPGGADFAAVAEAAAVAEQADILAEHHEENLLASSKLGDYIQAVIGKGLAEHARVVSLYPLRSLAFGAFLILFLLAGLVFVEMDTSDEILLLRRSYAEDAWERNRADFPQVDAIEVMAVADATPSGSGMLHPGLLTKFGREVDDMLKLKTPEGVAWEDVCDRLERGTCKVDTVFHLCKEMAGVAGLPFNVDAAVGEVEGLAKATETFCGAFPDTCADILTADVYLSAPVTRHDDGRVQTASVRVFFSLDISAKEEDRRAFEKAVHDHNLGPEWKSESTERDGYRLLDFSRHALGKEQDRAASSDVPLIGLVCILVLVFLCSAITAPSAPRPRVTLAFACLVVILLSLVCGIGLGAYVGVPMTPLTGAMIVTLVGVAVDGIVIIVHAYDRLPEEPTADTVTERVVVSWQTSGNAITLTSATSIICMLAASIIDIPVISYFCASTACGMIVLYIFQFTLVVPLFIFTEKQRCLRAERMAENKAEEQTDAVVQVGVVDFNTQDAPASDRRRARELATQFLAAPAVGGGFGLLDAAAKKISSSRMIQAVTLVSFFATVALSARSLADVKADVDLTSYFADESFIHDYFANRRKYYDAKEPYHLVFEHPMGVMPTNCDRSDIDALVSNLEAQDFLWPAFNWMRAFDTYLALNRSADASESLEQERARYQRDAAAFGARVQQFLESPALVNGTEIITPWSFKRNIVLENGIVKRSQLAFYTEANFAVQERYINNFLTLQRLVFPNGPECPSNLKGKFCNSLLPDTYGVANVHRYAERDNVIIRIFIENLLFAGAVVTAVIMVMLDPFVGVFVGCVVVAIDVLVIAMMGVLGCSLDMTSFICLCMTVGLTVDFSTHTVHSYMHAKGEPDARLYHAQSTMGLSVLAGGGSTLLGICVLAFSSSSAFRTFFYVLSSAIGIGMVVGVCVSPLLMKAIHSGIRVSKFLLAGASNFKDDKYD